MKKSILLFTTIMFLSGCSARAILVNKKTNYDPKTEARFRIYQTNGNATTKVVSDTSCEEFENGSKRVVSRNPFSKDNVHNGLPRRTLKNVTIGMPLTKDAVSALNRSSYFDTDSFTEITLKANKPAIVRGKHYFGTSDYSESCNIIGEFMPVAGKDYEVSFSMMGSYCRMFIHELEPFSSPEEPRIQAKLGKETLYKKCIY